jgi:hypothetical protein
VFEWLKTATPVEWLLLIGGLLHFSQRAIAAWVEHLARAPKPPDDEDRCVKRGEWEGARREDIEAARHFTRNQLVLYPTRELYDRDQRETHRRLRALEEHDR